MNALETLIDKEWLDKYKPCSEGREWYLTTHQQPISVKELLDELLAGHLEYSSLEKLKWANWLVVQPMTSTQRVRYAIYAVEPVLHIFEEARPDDKRPRDAINAAKNYSENPCKKTKRAAQAAGEAAGDAAWDAACKETLIKIINYGIGLLKKEQVK